MQTKIGSIFEVLCNTLTGFAVAWLLTHHLFPTYFDLELTISQSWIITVIYTLVSIIRSYIWRRIFNYFILKREIQFRHRGF